MYPVSTAFQNAMYGNHKGALRVDVCNISGAVLSSIVADPDTSSILTAGSVDVDETRQVRRQLSLTLESSGRLSDLWIPRAVGDLLHPASMNELRVYRGVDYQNGQVELAPLGVFRISKPKAVKSPDGTYEITITGQDRSAWVSRTVWQQPYEVSAGTDLTVAIYNALEYLMPSETFSYNMPPSPTYAMPDTIWGTDITTGANDPWKDLVSAAASGGYELYFDPVGVVTVTPIVIPTTQSVAGAQGVPLASFIEGVNCTLTEIGEIVDETVEYNGVIVVSNPPGSAPAVQGSAWVTNPASPVYYLGPWGQVPYIIKTTALTTSVQCQAMAQAQLQLIYRAMDTIDFSCVPNPSLQEGDIVSLYSPGMGINSNYVFSASVIPLDWKTDQTVTCRPQVNANVA